MALRKNSAISMGTLLLLAASPATAQATAPFSGADHHALASNVTDQFVDIDGGRIRVRIEGQPAAPAIILIHGFSFSLETWDAWAKDLTKNYRVIRYDLSGHGLSSPDPGRRYATQDRVRQLKRLLKRLHIRKAVFAGNSYGGLIAWNFAAQFPRHVDKLILIDSAAYTINGVADKAAPVPQAMHDFLMKPTPAGIAYSASQIYAHPEKLSPERLELMRTMIARPENGLALVAHLEQFTLPAPDARLAQIQAPTLILWGRADKVIPVAHAHLLDAAIPRSQLIIYDDVGHVPQEEAAAQSLVDVSEFLKSQQ
jgi:pimeloyl-ACP methyl ester carboxylesterase